MSDAGAVTGNLLRLELGCGNSPTPGYVHHDRIKHAAHVDLAWDLRRYPWPFMESWVEGRGGITLVESLSPVAYRCVAVSGDDPPPLLTAYHGDPGLSRERSEELERLKATLLRHQDGGAPIVATPVSLTVTSLPLAGGFLDSILALDVFEHVSVEVQPWLDECWRLLRTGGVLDIRLPCWDNPLSYRDPTHLRLYGRETFDYWDERTELWRDFGSFYFAESNKWWHVEEVFRDNGDWRYRLTKRGADDA